VDLLGASRAPYAGFTVREPASEALHVGDTSSETSESTEVKRVIRTERFWSTIREISDGLVFASDARFSREPKGDGSADESRDKGLSGFPLITNPERRRRSS
jgi:hypothetical protein